MDASSWVSPCGRYCVYFAELNGPEGKALPWHAGDGENDIHTDLAVFGYGFATRDEAIAAVQAHIATPREHGDGREGRDGR